MKKIASQILAVLLLTVSIAAQVEDNQPKLIDEFGFMPADELMARIDALANQIAATPNSRALIRVSGGQKNYFAFSYVYGSEISAYWSHSRKLPSAKLSIQFCDIGPQPGMVKFFVMRENDKTPVCNENLTAPPQTTLFETVTFDFYDFPKFKFTPIESDGFYMEGANGEYSGFSQNALKKLLKDSPQSRVCIVAYGLTNFKTNLEGEVISKDPKRLDKKYVAARMINHARAELLKNGFAAARIVALDGGYVNGNARRLEFWFVPPGGAVPKPQPDYVPKRKRNR